MINHRWLTRWKSSLRQSRLRRVNRRHKAEHRPMAIQILEPRMMLAAADCLGQIEGTMYVDLTDNGLTGDDTRLDSETVHLYLDGGDNVFSSSDGVAAGDDSVIGVPASTDGNGEYTFTDLAAGTYFVEQDSGLAGLLQKPGEDVVTVVISAAQAQGVAGTTIDLFNEPNPPQQIQTTSATPATSSAAGLSNVIGGERDLYVERTSGSLNIDLNANFPTGFLNYSANFFETGVGRVTWDGGDGSPALDATGLGSVDLTDGGLSTGILTEIGSTRVNTTVTYTVYTDTGTGTNSMVLPGTGGTDLVFISFSDFAGTPNFTNVGAIELEINAPTANTAVLAAFVEAHGPTVLDANFANFEPLTLGGSIFRDRDNSGTFQSGTESTISGVNLTLFEDTNLNGSFDPGTDLQVTSATSTTTSVAGDYAFTNLFPGEYIVQIDASNFNAAASLENLMSSTGNGVAPDPDDDVSDDDNGDHIGGVTTDAIVSRAITLSGNAEPVNDGDADNNTNLALDFGVFGNVDIAVTKSDNVDPVTAGSSTGNLVYTVTATNNGPTDATGVTVTDALIAALPTGWSLFSAAGSGSTTFASGTGLWTIGDLPNGDSETLTVTLTVGADAAAGTTTNTAAVTSVTEPDSNAVNDSVDEDTTVIRIVDIAVVKSDNVDPVTAGAGPGNLIYTVTTTNNGPSDATNVAVTDALIAALPADWSLVSAIGSGSTTFTTGTGVWNIGNLVNGASETLTVTLTVGASAVAGTTTNTATLSVTESDSNSANNTATEDTTISRNVDIAVLKSDNVDPVTAGSGTGNLVYTVTAINNGPSDASGVAITDALIATLPAGWSLVSGTGSGSTSFSGATGIWAIGDLPNGDFETLTLTLTLDSTAASGTTTNSASVSAVNETDTNAANDIANEDTTVNRLVDIAVLKSDNVDPVTAGSGAGNLVYTVTATNTGPSDASGVAITDALMASLPTGWSLDSGTSTGTTTFSGGTGIWTIGELASGASEILTLTISVGASAAIGTVTNTVTVSAVNESDSNSANDVATEDTTVNRQVDIAVLKSDNVDPVTAGSGAGNLIYTVTASNNGPSDATGVAITDALMTSLPTGWSLDSASGSGSTTFSAGVWTIGNLSSGNSETLTLTITVGLSAATVTTTNTAAVSAVNEADANAANDVATEDTSVAREVDIAVLKSDNIDPVTAGSGTGNLVYTVIASNNGPSNATGVEITDALIASLPQGWSLDGAVGSGTTTFSSGTGVWTVGDLNAGDSETLTVTITVGSTAASGTITNTATITNLNEPDSDLNNNTASEDTTVNRVVDIAVLKSDNVDPVVAGSGAGNLVYTVTATNNGPSDATGVAVTDALIASLPTGWTLASAVGSGSTTFAAGTGVWTIGDLATGASEILTVNLSVGASAASGTTTNTAVVSAVTESEINLNNNSATEDTTVVREVDIEVVKSDNVDPVIAGSGAGNLVYTVTATNNGPSDATAVQLTDALITSLPAGFSLVSAVGSGSTSFDSGTGIWTIGDLDNANSETLTITLTVGTSAAAGTITNTATLSNLTDTDTDPGNNSDDENTTIDHEVDIAVTKSDNVDPVTAGSGAGNLVYTVTATNNGPSNATGVAVTDALIAALPIGFTLDSAIGSGSSTFNSTSGIWAIGDLNSGAVASLTVTLTAGSTAASGTITNTAAVSSVDQTDTVPANDSADEDTTINRRVDIALTKSDATDPVVAGSGTGNLVYAVTATNLGPSEASDLLVTDLLIANLPTGFTLESATGTGGSTFDSGTGVWTIGTLDSGSTETLTVTITVDITASATAMVTNVATVSNLNETDTDPTNDTGTENTTITHLVDISVSKSDSTDPVVAGSGTGNLVYTITATNTRPGNATGVEITDALLVSLPPGISFVSVVGSGGSTFNSSTGVWSIGDLAGGDSRQLIVTLTVDGSVAAGTITNVAEVTDVNETDADPTNDVATEDTSVIREIDLVVTKTDNMDPVRSPGFVSYTITVANNGPSSATNVVLTDMLSTQVSFVSAVPSQGDSVESGGVVTTTLGTIEPGSAATLVLVVSVDLPLGGTVNNIATATADETEINIPNNTDTEQTIIDPAQFSISGFVYQDLNDNGIKDSGEPPIERAQVGLFGSDGNGDPVIRVVFTDSSGAFLFDSLLIGTYNLFEVQPLIYVDGQDAPGTGAGNAVTTGNDTFFGLELTDTNAVDFNFGEGPQDESKRDFLSSGQTNEPPPPVDPAATGSLNGRVVLDNNSDGIINSGDTGIFGASVTLAGNRSTGEPVVVTTRTDFDGSYQFTGLPAGNYSIIEAQPNGYDDGPELPGTLMADSILDDIFAAIALPDGGTGSDFNFLERPESSSSSGSLAPLLAAQTVESSAGSKVSWEPVASATHYDVWLSQLTDGGGLVYRNESVSGTSIMLPSSLALATHRLWVRGIDDVGLKGPWSQPMTFDFSPRTEIHSPGSVTFDSTPKFDWADVDGALTYDLVVHDSAGTEYINVSGLTDSTFTSSTVLPKGSYRMWLRSHNADVSGAWSDGTEFSVTGAPTILGPEIASVFASPMLEWNGSADEYRVWVNDVTGASTKLLEVTVQGTSLLLTTPLQEGHRYRYWVQGIEGGASSAWSGPQTFEVAASTTIVGVTSGNQPTIEWQAYPGATHYDVWVSDSSGLYLREQNVTGTQYSFAAAIPDGDYRAWVQPEGVSGSAKWSTVAKFTVGGLSTPVLTSPVAVTTVGERATTTATAQTARLAADEVLTLNDVSIALSAGLTQTQVVDRINEFTAQTGVVADTDTGATRLYSIAYGTDASISVVSNQAAAATSSGFGTSVVTDTGVNVVGTIDAISYTSDRTPTFTWTQDSDTDTTEIWINHDGVSNRLVHEQNLTGTSYTSTLSFAAGRYSIWIRSRSSAGLWSAWSSALRLEIT